MTLGVVYCSLVTSGHSILPSVISVDLQEMTYPLVRGEVENPNTRPTVMNPNPQLHAASIPKSSKPPKLREVRLEDHAQVAALAVKFDLNAQDYEAWAHLWTQNPASRTIKGKFPMGWVLETADGAIAGYLGTIPLSYEFEGKRLLAAATRSWVVDTAYRAYSLLLLGTYFQQLHVDLFLATTVNSQSIIPFSVVQGLQVPVGAWDRTQFWITNARGFGESLLRKKGWAMAKSLSYPLSVALLLRDHFSIYRFRRNGNRVTVLPCLGFDDRFDAFWLALRERKSKVLLAVRDRQTLEWHFKFPLLQNTAWIYIVEDNRGLVAYSVFLRQDRRQVGLTRVRLADFQCLEQEEAPTLLAAMLQAAIDRCRQESIHMLELIGLPPQLEAVAEGASPHRRRLPNWMYFYKTRDSILGEKLKNPAVWEPSLYDGDSSL